MVCIRNTVIQVCTDGTSSTTVNKTDRNNNNINTTNGSNTPNNGSSSNITLSSTRSNTQNNTIGNTPANTNTPQTANQTQNSTNPNQPVNNTNYQNSNGNTIIINNNGTIVNISAKSVILYNVYSNSQQTAGNNQVKPSAITNNVIANFTSFIGVIRQTNPIAFALSKIDNDKQFVFNFIKRLQNLGTKLNELHIRERKKGDYYQYALKVKGDNNIVIRYKLKVNDENIAQNLKLKINNTIIKENIKINDGNKVRYLLNIKTPQFRLKENFKGTQADYKYAYDIKSNEKNTNIQFSIFKPKNIALEEFINGNLKINKKPSQISRTENQNTLNKIQGELKLSLQNTENNPAKIEIGNLTLKAWIEPTKGNNYKVWFKAIATKGNIDNYILTLLNNKGQKPEHVGGNPYVLSLKKGETDTEYWTPVGKNEFPIKIVVSTNGKISKGTEADKGSNSSQTNVSSNFNLKENFTWKGCPLSILYGWLTKHSCKF
jgi:hypothetical protein